MPNPNPKTKRRSLISFFKAYRIPNNAKAVSGSERKHFFGYTTPYESEIFKGGLDRCKEKKKGQKSRTNVALMELKGKILSLSKRLKIICLAL
jgi:hypothetical protein